MSNFPPSVKTFPTLFDLVDNVLMLYQNERDDGITAEEQLVQKMRGEQ